MIKAWYPSSANKENLYVYLNTLQTDNPGLYSAAKALINANSHGDAENGFKIESALQFLDAAASNEAVKEINFLRYRLGDNVLSEIMDGDMINYPKMIAKINEANKTLNKFQIELEQEMNRFKKVQDARVIENKKVKYKIGEGSHSYTQSIGGYIQATMRQLTDLSPEKEDKVTQICRNVLIGLINKTDAFNGLDISQVSAILGLAQAQIMPLLEKEFKNGNLTTKSGTLSSKKIEQIITQDENYNRLISNSLDTLQGIANRLLNSFSVFENKNGSDYVRAKRNYEQAVSNLKGIVKSSSNTARNRAAKKIIKMSENPFSEGAIRMDVRFKAKNTGIALEYKIMNDFESSIVTGKSGGKIDVSAYLGDFEVDIRANEGSMNNIVNSITSETQSDFKGVGESFENAYKELNESLLKQRELNEDLKNAFILHTSAKDYYTTATSEFKGFEGGTYKGLQIFDSLDALAGAGFGETDIQWLKACAVNTSKSAVGASIKTSLEKYISIFATMILFDDGLTIAQETVANAQASYQPLNVLHLFNVNGFYVPSSYLLRELHTRLTTVADDMNSNKIIRVNIATGGVDFKNELNYLTYNGIFNDERWEAIKNIQINAMSVRIHFLRNFMDILNELTGA